MSLGRDWGSQVRGGSRHLISRPDQLQLIIDFSLNLMASFTIAHYALDGESLGVATRNSADLSQQWMDVCSQFFDTHGPIFSESMGGTLSRYMVKCTAGMFEFRVAESRVFVGAVLVGRNEEQDRALAKVLALHVKSVDVPTPRPLFVVVNLLNQEVTQNDQHAMFELAVHFAAAYLVWSKA